MITVRKHEAIVSSRLLTATTAKLFVFSTTLLLCASQDPIGITPDGYNCEPMADDFHVRWRVLDGTLDVELLGRVDRGTYMGFGISGLPQTQTLMTGADAVVAVCFGAVCLDVSLVSFIYV